MPKSGQARVPSREEQQRLFEVIQQNRHPEKNMAIMQISFKLGLRAQEIALLQIKEVAQLKPCGEFTLLKVMALPAAYTKGADAMNRSKSEYERKTISFSKAAFDQMLLQVEKMVQAGATIQPEDFYPTVKKHRGRSRDLPMVDEALREALNNYILLRLSKAQHLKPSDPLFVTQKGGPYSPNTLQEHMALMLRQWAGIEKASSHSGRRALLTDVIHNQKKSVKVAQKIAGHVSPSTTLIYEEPPEEVLSDALANVGKSNR
jgi:integrase